jgi:hypothetical protein
MLGEAIRGAAGDGGDLARMIEMGVDHHVLVQAAAKGCDRGQGFNPGVIGQDLLRKHGEALGGVADAADIGHRQQALADEADVLGLEVIGVAAADDDVLEFGARSGRPGVSFSLPTTLVSPPIA